MDADKIVPIIIVIMSIVVPLIVIAFIVHIVRRTKQKINNVLHGAGQNLLDGAINAAFKTVGVSNAATMMREADVTPERVNTASSVAFDKLYARYPEFNLDVYKLRAQTIVKAANTGDGKTEALEFLTEEFKPNFSTMNNSSEFAVNASGMTKFIDNANNPKVVFEVAYKLGSEYHKDEVMFSNMAETDNSGAALSLCPICRAPFTPFSLEQRRCEYCETPIALETKWMCMSHKRIR